MEELQDIKLKLGGFTDFTREMRERLEHGHEKYGNDWLFTDLCEEIEQELIDVANYAYLLRERIKLIKEILRGRIKT